MADSAGVASAQTDDMSHKSVHIDASTRAEWQRLQRVDAATASEFYFEHILPQVVQHHQELPSEVAPCDLLVSLSGFSPETTVLATTFMRPRRLVVVASQSTESYSQQSTGFLVKTGLMSADRIETRIVEPSDPEALLANFEDILSNAFGKCVVDVTGGKKIMSAVAAHAAWERGLAVCYVESGAYNPEMRRPEPGSERIVVIAPPARLVE